MAAVDSCADESPPDTLIREHAALVARQVRAVALIGRCRADQLTMLRTATRIESLAESGAIPFVLPCADGYADFGYAAATWALDLYRWVITAETVPPEQKHRVVGLLLGYGVDAIRLFEDHGCGRLFHVTGASAAPASR
jgi:hypothetical protein